MFEKAIEIIMQEPPELHYPAYYADLLRAKGSEIPNSSDLISRRALMKELTDFVRASNNSDFAQTPTWNDAVSLVGSMPSAEPETHEERTETHSCDLIDRQAAIDALNGEIRVTGRANAEAVRGYVNLICDRIKRLPPAQPRERLVAKIDVSEEQIRDALEKMRNEPVHLIPSAHLLPSAEPERKKGKWIVDALANNIYHCSECETDAPVEPTGGTEYKSNYCPYCGLDMRGETDED